MQQIKEKTKNPTVIVIPARMASTRFPNKPLAMIAGKTMIERVWRIGQAVASADEVVIATDSEELKKIAENFGAKVVMTKSECRTGTDRVAEAVKALGYTDGVFFSLQGDAVLTPPFAIHDVLQAMLQDRSVQMATPAIHLTGEALTEFVASKRRGSSSGTAVVFDRNQNALYFSKALIPYCRSNNENDQLVYRHIGLYAYRFETLQRLSTLSEGALEKAESLEQLRALENGIPIRVVLIKNKGRTLGSVDQPDDVHVVERIIAAEGELV